MTARRVLEITIETFSSSKTYVMRAYRDSLPTFLINTLTVRYYAFTTIEGVEERFLYSDIKHISFKEIDSEN